ncbi:MAG: hypothetical protein M0P31_02480 [Solirubrobacteraceae bacterium]|nr:hypothetical protein [Solirubrobacteraceae bacterium]
MIALLLVRFTALLLGAVAVAVTAAVTEAGWVLVVALLALVVATLLLVRTIFHYAAASDWEGPEAEAELQLHGLVEHETGLPLREDWRPHRTTEVAGEVPVPAAWRGPEGDHRVLLVATEAVPADRLDEALDGIPDDGDRAVLVIAPAVDADDRPGSFGNPGPAIRHAERAVHDTVEALHDRGIAANGHIGPADPARAVSDGLRTYAAERVVVARHAAGDGRDRRDAVDVAAAEFGVPVREIVLA